jgi:hypothetical protein
VQQQLVRQVRADEAGAAGDQDPSAHSIPPIPPMRFKLRLLSG